MTILTFQQTRKIAQLIADYRAPKLTTENKSNEELVVYLREEDETPFRRIVLNEKGQVTHIRVV